MAILSSSEAKAILDKVLSFSKADEMEVSLGGGRNANTRFGRNSVNTSGDIENVGLGITARYGLKSGFSNTNTLDDAGIEQAVRIAEEIAKLRPDDPEQQPFLGKQEYTTNDATYDEATYNADASIRARGIATVIDPARSKNLVAAGLYDHSAGFNARANTAGNFGYARSSFASFTTTVRTENGTGSGWANSLSHRIRDVDAAKASVAAIDKAQRSINPVAIEPGNYTVILEPNAVGDLVGNMLFALNARSADEGRSVFSKKGGGNRLGEKFFGDQVNIFTDPSYPGAPGGPFDGQGMPTKRLDFVSGGVIKNLSYDRYWAKKQGKEPTPGPTNIIFQGGTASIDDMIKSTERGILVTRFWYIRPVDAQTLLVTGLTRDGLFLIENGRIKSSIKNFRFNETPIKMLNNIEMMGPATRIIGSERLGANIPVIVPALKVKDFSFTSLSEAV